MHVRRCWEQWNMLLSALCIGARFSSCYHGWMLARKACLALRYVASVQFRIRIHRVFSMLSALSASTSLKDSHASIAFDLV